MGKLLAIVGGTVLPARLIEPPPLVGGMSHDAADDQYQHGHQGGRAIMTISCGGTMGACGAGHARMSARAEPGEAA